MQPLTLDQVRHLVKLLKEERRDLEGCTAYSTGPNADHMLVAALHLIRSLSEVI